jgi:hypothetical protein
MGCLQTNMLFRTAGNTGYSPRRPSKLLSFLILRSEPRFAKNHSFSLSGLRQIHVEPTVGLCRKSAVYGLNGHRAYFVIALSLVTYEQAV